MILTIKIPTKKLTYCLYLIQIAAKCFGQCKHNLTFDMLSFNMHAVSINGSFNVDIVEITIPSLVS